MGAKGAGPVSFAGCKCLRCSPARIPSPGARPWTMPGTGTEKICTLCSRASWLPAAAEPRCGNQKLVTSTLKSCCWGEGRSLPLLVRGPARPGDTAFIQPGNTVQGGRPQDPGMRSSVMWFLIHTPSAEEESLQLLQREKHAATATPRFCP